MKIKNRCYIRRNAYGQETISNNSVKFLIFRRQKNEMKSFFVGLLICFIFGNAYVHGGAILDSLIGSSKGTSPLDKFSVSNLANSGADTIKGVVSQLPSIIPTPESMLQLTKNGIGGYPVEIMFTAINKFCKSNYFSQLRQN